MPKDNDDNVQKIRPVDTRRFEAEDDDGHIIGSHEAENSQENMKKIRLEEEKDNSALNKTDARGTMDGDEIL